jgi:hypothetical protein
MNFFLINNASLLQQYWQILLRDYFGEPQPLQDEWSTIINHKQLACCLLNNQLLACCSLSIDYNLTAQKLIRISDFLLSQNSVANKFLLDNIHQQYPSNPIYACISTKNQLMQQNLALNKYQLQQFCFIYE